MTLWDVVVVGAGPAGSATALRLARAGCRVLLLDRARFPRDKPCGECVNPAAVHALEALGVLRAVRAEAHEELRGWRIAPPGAAPFEGTFRPEETGLAIRRTALDSLLLDAARRAGAAVETGVQVSDLVREEARVVGVRAEDEPVLARLVVGADGLRSVVMRRLELLKRPPKLRKLALTAHVRGVEGLDGRGELLVRPHGCVGVAAVGEGMANVTVVAAGEEAARVAGAREEYFDRVLRETPRLAGVERAGEVLATGPFDFPTRRAVADGALLVGDAAGYYDPFTGQGIYRALRGAELAVRVAIDALAADDCSARRLAPYDRARRREFAAGQRLQHVIELFVSRPPLLRAAARPLRRFPALADAIVAMTGDVASLDRVAR